MSATHTPFAKTPEPPYIRTGGLSGPEIAEFLREHLRTLAEVSPPESRHALNLDELRKPDITFWSVWEGREVVGCGALKELDPQQGEIKSMRTAAAHLRKGVGTAVLEQIIAEAKRRGYRRLSLETGAMPYFTPAHRLYRKFGFTPLGPPVASVKANFIPMLLRIEKLPDRIRQDIARWRRRNDS